ncbi:hypothetical protein Asulf_01533 [Archaeoglobus sulfaticallidus PM70-1]|uniref:Uncharacterized protein n=1 Tax=Archaeoglobus sulfaticallidus PM70-1 TaxID=387631 RepID=N0BLV0_9EURY|nr:phage tail tube protein [Archaeoglobus sulfaticallidus]AGK61511.1 hypothetical protein Asulf_01533 [Archaeoglobus sulfaticallidus PM70-1]
MAVQGFKTVVEYVEESEFGTFPTDPAMQWIGLVDIVKPVIKPKTETKRYLAANASTNRLEKLMNVKVGEEIGLELEYYPQSLPGFLQYFIGSATGLADDLASVSVGIIHKGSGEYMTLSGLVGEEVTLEIPEDGVVKVSARLVGADATDPSTSDYIGLGSHAAEDSTEPLTWEDVSNVQMNYGAGFVSVEDYVSSIEIRVRNELKVIKDIGDTKASRIVAIKPVSREVTLGLEMNYDDLDMLLKVRSLTELGFKFTIGGKTFTLSGVKFPELPTEFSPDDLVGDKITSLPVTGLTIA